MYFFNIIFHVVGILRVGCPSQDESRGKDRSDDRKPRQKHFLSFRRLEGFCLAKGVLENKEREAEKSEIEQPGF
jgi:hypothetical protein